MFNFDSIAKSKFLQKDVIFVLLFVIFASFYYDAVLDKGPLNNHLWRQTDCLSMTRNYAEGADFLAPEMHFLSGDDKTSGKSVGEFPILYYTVGSLWRIFGESYLIYRVFYLLILFAGIFAFYKSLKLLLNNQFWAVCTALLLLTSPVYISYGTSFLTDVPAFSFALIGIYYFLQYHRKKLIRVFYLSMFFFAIAGLIKVSSLIAFIFLFGILILETFGLKSLGKKKLFHNLRHEWIGFLAVFVSILSWYAYAHYFNEIHQFKYTWNHALPIWNVGEDAIEPLIKGLKNFTSIVFFSRPILYLFFFIGIINLFLWKKIPVFAYLANVLIILGCTMYFLLWTPLLGNHDYYFVALLILFPGIFIPFIWFIKSNYKSVFEGRLIKVFMATFLFFNFLYCLNVVQLKTLAQSGNFTIVGNHSFVEVMRWTNAIDRQSWQRFENMKGYIEEIGIKKEDKIISLPDNSLNISLFLVDRKGWAGFDRYDKKRYIEKYIEKGAKYLFISDDALLSQKHLMPYMTNEVGTFEGIHIYKL